MASGYENDGERDANGNCLGTIYIFNGKKNEMQEIRLSNRIS
jgi:hypothetical protein